MLQFLPGLRARGLVVSTSSLLGDSYIEALYSGARPPISTIAGGYLRRVTVSPTPTDVVWLEKELLPMVPDWVETRLLRRPFVLDIDDAWYLSYSAHARSLVRLLLSRKIERLMSAAAAVVVGNHHLEMFARNAGAREVVYIPSVVDHTRYALPKASRVESRPEQAGRALVVGWIGSPSTVKYLTDVLPALERVACSMPMILRVIGAQVEHEGALLVQCRPWSEATEVRDLHEIDVGIMPLRDTEWERGKCAYKLVQYMAAGRSVVASDVGANSTVVRHGVDGYLVSSRDGWHDAIVALADPRRRALMGASGATRVADTFSVQAQVGKLHRVLELAGTGV